MTKFDKYDKKVVKNVTPPRVKIKLTRFQSDVYKSLFVDFCRNIVVCAGRRCGKSYITRTCLINFATMIPNSRCLCLAVTQAQANKLFFEELAGLWKNGKCLKEGLIPIKLIHSVNTRTSALEIYLNNGSKIVCSGSDNTNALVGGEYELIIYDEFALQKASVYGFISPMTGGDSVKGLDGKRGGHQIMISTPRGMNHFKTLFDLGWYKNPQRMPNWISYHITAARSGMYTDEELLRKKQELGEEQYLSEYEASFETDSGRVYKMFSEANIIDDFEPNPSRPLLIGMDFNFAHFCISVCQEINGKLVVFNEHILNGATTEQMAAYIRKTYKNFNIIIYPDPKGSSNHTSSKESDHKVLLRRQFNFKLHTKKQVPIRSRVNAVNALIQNANEERKLFICKKCRYLIEAFSYQIYDIKTGKPEKNEKNKLKDYSDLVDGLGYLIEYRYPVEQRVATLDGVVKFKEDVRKIESRTNTKMNFFNKRFM